MVGREKALVLQLKSSMKNDAKKWTLLRANTRHYLQGAILAERFFDEFFRLASGGVQSFSDAVETHDQNGSGRAILELLRQFINLVPEQKVNTTANLLNSSIICSN